MRPSSAVSPRTAPASSCPRAQARGRARRRSAPGRSGSSGYEFGHEVELERFDEYWEGPALLDRVITREITEPTVRLTGLRTGELHMINDIPADRMEEIRADSKFKVLTWFPLNWDFINLNHEFEPFKDPRVRLAFDLIIDKEMLLQGALWGQGRLTASPSYPTSSSYNAALKNRPQDIAKAKALLAEAGYGPGKLNPGGARERDGRDGLQGAASLSDREGWPVVLLASHAPAYPTGTPRHAIFRHWHTP